MGNWLIILLSASIALSGIFTATLLSGLRSELVGTNQVVRLRGDLSALVAAHEQLENGEEEALDVVDSLISDLRTDAGRAADHFSEMADSTSFVMSVADAYERAFDLWGRGVAPSAELDAELDSLARRTDAYLIRLGRATEERADRVYLETRLLIVGGTLLIAGFVLVILLRLRRSADIVRRTELEAESNRRIRALIEHAPDVVVLLDRTTQRFTYASPSVTRILGYEPEELAAVEIAAILHPDDLRAAARAYGRVQETGTGGVAVTCRIRHADGSWRHFEMSLSSPQQDEGLDGVVINARDVSDRIELQRSLSHQANHDPLTGLANRAAFVELVHAGLTTPLAPGGPSVIFVDLDGFKEINDSLGHAVGDEVLMTVAARLVTLTRHRDHVARLGGDEFAILIDEDDAAPLADRLVEIIGQPIELATGPVQVGASVGVARAEDAPTVEDLLRCADVAMYDAKARGKNRVSYFEPQMHQAVVDRLAMRSALDEALERDEFRLVYQPEIDLRDGRLLGYEALIRWHRLDGTVVPPFEFIPAAEASGQIIGIGRWVLRAALCQLSRWHAEFDAPSLTMAVNVSARQLEDDDFVRIVAEEVERSGVPARCLTLELTETTLIRDVALATQRLGELHDLGVLIAIDDYGAGHASIGYLREFPVDIVKIDGSFVQALDDRPAEAEAYLRSITDLARALSIETIAEGIEHPHQLERLRALECRVGQGYHLARPLEVEAARAFLAARSALIS